MIDNWKNQQIFGEIFGFSISFLYLCGRFLNTKPIQDGNKR